LRRRPDGAAKIDRLVKALSRQEAEQGLGDSSGPPSGKEDGDPPPSGKEGSGQGPSGKEGSGQGPSGKEGGPQTTTMP